MWKMIAGWLGWPMGSPKLEMDAESVTVRRGRHVETVRWETLREVSIITTDRGPVVEDVFWILEDDRGGCAVPHEVEGVGDLLARLQELPGFRNEAVILAMGCTDNGRFVCWQADGPRPDPG